MENIINTITTPALISIVTALGTSILTHREIKRRAEVELRNQFASRYNEKRWEAYTKFTSLAREQIEAFRRQEANRMYTEVEESIKRLASDLFLIGSDDVVKIFRAWRNYSSVNGPTDPTSIQSLTELLIAMRSDLGYEETDLDLDSILGSLVPNYNRAL